MYFEVLSFTFGFLRYLNSRTYGKTVSRVTSNSSAGCGNKTEGKISKDPRTDRGSGSGEGGDGCAHDLPPSYVAPLSTYPEWTDRRPLTHLEQRVMTTRPRLQTDQNFVLVDLCYTIRTRCSEP